MKKSQSIHLAFALLAASMLSGCSEEKTEIRRCVGEDNIVVEDDKCEHPTYVNGHPVWFWYYGGRGGYETGSVVEGGSRNPTPGYRAVSPVSRGGFGSTGARGEGAGE
jgi:hypothetical protein